MFLIQVLNSVSNTWSNFVQGLHPMAKRIFEEHPYFSLYVKNFPKFASAEARESESIPCNFKASTLLSLLIRQRLWSVHWTQWHFLLSTPNINSSQFNGVYYIGWGCEHINSLALEILVLCARTRCRNTNTYILSLGQLLCQCFCVFSI